MLLSFKKVPDGKKEQKEIVLKAVHPRHGSDCAIDKAFLCNAVQMLQENESTNIRFNESVSVKIKNNGDNNFSLECTSLAYNTDAAFSYLMQQKIPVHSNCVELSMQIQDHLGLLPFKNGILNTNRRNSQKHGLDDTFLADNSTIISKLTDILNQNLKKNLLASDHKQKTLVYSYRYAAQQLKIAAIFCSTAFQNKACMWHISQGMISDFNKEAQTSVYEGVEPEKQHVTVLLKGDTTNERIMRINLAVRIFPKDHIFTKQIMPTIMAMNSCSCDTAIMVLTGVNSQIAAAMYINSDSQENNNMNNVAFSAYLPYH